MKRLITFFLVIASIHVVAYVPTVEGLFRHGGNPDVTTNALVITASVAPHNPYEEKTEPAANPLWVKWVYNMSPQGKLKLTQLIYSSASMVDANLIDKVYVSELSPQSFGASQTERGFLLSVFNSILINDGSFMIDFLQNHGVSVNANTEILNQDKVALLTRYKTWLIQSNGGRSSTAEDSPLSPTSASEKERVNKLMSSPMYLDSGLVSLSRYHGEPAWQIKTENFESFIDDTKREIKQVILRQPNGDIEITAHEPTLLDGLHRIPRSLIIKSALDQHYQIRFTSLKYFNENPSELLARLRRYDQILAHKRVSVERPAFLY